MKRLTPLAALALTACAPYIHHAAPLVTFQPAPDAPTATTYTTIRAPGATGDQAPLAWSRKDYLYPPGTPPTITLYATDSSATVELETSTTLRRRYRYDAARGVLVLQ